MFDPPQRSLPTFPRSAPRSSPDAVESAEILLDTYEQDVIDLPGSGSYRDDKTLAAARISSLIGDLAAYAEHHRIDFYPSSHARLTHSRPSRRYPETAPSEDGWQIGSEVRVRPGVPDVELPASPGYVSALHPGEAPECTVVFPGVPARQFRVQADHLCAADPFPIVSTTHGPVLGAARAEAAFVRAAAHIRLARDQGDRPTPQDLVNHACLAVGLAQWTGISAGRIEAVLTSRIEDAIRPFKASLRRAAPDAPARRSR
ncbi:hypothetical protein [Actinomadura gamaensis]|uniref:Uncharacterized protein n=1 Tax=Actinomadura gamaensis TaxID=1763541 RepID=A0ABV9TSI0_9ACTN